MRESYAVTLQSAKCSKPISILALAEKTYFTKKFLNSDFALFLIIFIIQRFVYLLLISSLQQYSLDTSALKSCTWFLA